MTKRVQAVIKGGVISLILALTASCASSYHSELERQIGVLEQEVAAAKADAANAAAAANNSQACCDATNEKIDRMFQNSQSK